MAGPWKSWCGRWRPSRQRGSEMAGGLWALLEALKGGDVMPAQQPPANAGTMPGTRALLSPSEPQSPAEQIDRAAWIRSLQEPRVQVDVGQPTILSRMSIEDMPHNEASEAPGLEPDADADDLTEAQPMDYPEVDVRSQHMQALRAQAEAEAAKRRAAMHGAPSGWAQAMMEALAGR